MVAPPLAVGPAPLAPCARGRYLYLLFTPAEELPFGLDLATTHVLTTEAHVLRGRVAEAAEAGARTPSAEELEEETRREAERAASLYPPWWR